MSRMKRYQNPDLYELLAAEYVLGSMHGRARLRFESLMNERPYIQYAVEHWQERLHSLNEVLPAEKPSAQLWKSISKSISQPVNQKAPWFERLGLWQAATGLLSVAFAVSLMLPQQQTFTSPASIDYAPAFVSVLESRHDKPMMYASGSRQLGFVNVRMAEMPKIPPNEDWVLWAIPRNGGAPAAVGTILRDKMETRIELTQQEWKERMMETEVFGVTSEPRQSSWPKKPSSEIMYQGKCLEFT